MSPEVAQPGRARLRDVARAARVSKSIASRVLNDYPDLPVRPETRERVLAAAARLRYRPHAGARALAGAGSHAFALLVPPLTSQVYVSIIRGAYRRARELGYIVLLAEDFEEQAADETFSDLVEGGRVDGLIIASARQHHALIDSFERHPVPHVFVNREVPGQSGNVTMDNSLPSYLAVQHLSLLGHLTVGHVAGPRDNAPGSRRRSAFARAAKQAGLSSAPVQSADYTEQSAAAAVAKLLDEHPEITAVYASSLSQAIGVLHAARQRGLRVPEDLSVIGSDDAPLAAYLAPPLTTVAMPLASLGSSAVDELVAQLEGGAPRDIEIDTLPRLVVRMSTAPPRS